MLCNKINDYDREFKNLFAQSKSFFQPKYDQ